jgi:hypothetical protein
LLRRQRSDSGFHPVDHDPVRLFFHVGRKVRGGVGPDRQAQAFRLGPNVEPEERRRHQKR